MSCDLCAVASILPNDIEKAYAPLWFAESLPRGLLDIHARGFEPMRQRLR